MTYRQLLTRSALASGFALAMAVGAQAQPATTGGGGQMAYPDSLPSGQVKIPSNTARDTGNMAYPSSPGGVSSVAPPRSDNTGTMAYPAGNALGGKKAASTKTSTAAAMPAPTASGTPAATPQGEAAARALATAPGSQPVPYVDFLSPGSSAKAGHHHGKPAAKKPSA